MQMKQIIFARSDSNYKKILYDVNVGVIYYSYIDVRTAAVSLTKLSIYSTLDSSITRFISRERIVSGVILADLL